MLHVAAYGVYSASLVMLSRDRWAAKSLNGKRCKAATDDANRKRPAERRPEETNQKPEEGAAILPHQSHVGKTGVC